MKIDSCGSSLLIMPCHDPGWSRTSQVSGLQRPVNQRYWGLVNAPFTLDGDCLETGRDCLETGRDCANRPWSLVVVTSLHLVANVCCTVSTCMAEMTNIFHFCHQMNSHLLAEKGRDTVETKPWWSRMTKMQKKLRQNGATLRLYLNYVSTMSQQWDDKWRL